jgi:hypothetical protein
VIAGMRDSLLEGKFFKDVAEGQPVPRVSTVFLFGSAEPMTRKATSASKTRFTNNGL